MVVRRLVVSVALVVGAFALPAMPSYADGPADLYVATVAGGGNDANDCTQETDPCATVQHAVDLAAPFGTTINVGAGIFDGEVTVGSKLVSIVGQSMDTTTLTANTGAQGYVVAISSGTSTLSDLTLKGAALTELYVSATGIVHADRVALTGALGCELWVSAGVAQLTDSVVTGSSNNACGDAGNMLPGTIAMEHGGLTLTRTQVLDPGHEIASVLVKGGSFSADQSLFDNSTNHTDFDNSKGIDVKGGTATLTRSTVHAFGTGLLNEGGTSSVSDSTFQGNTVGVTSSSGAATVVRSTFQGELSSLFPEDPGTVAVAGSVLADTGIKNCGGAVTDLGYNLGTDASCPFTGTSHVQVDGLNLDDGLAFRGGGPLFLTTVGILWPSSAMDTIPAGATYGDDQPLCPATGVTDLRGVNRPGGDACDAGSMEMGGTVTTIDVPKTVKAHTNVGFQVHVVDAQDDLIQDSPNGFVTVRSGNQVLCENSPIDGNQAVCSIEDIPAGRLHLVAAFTPSDFNTVHPSSAEADVLSGTKPVLKTPRKVVVTVGQKVSLKLKASGLPAPLVRKIAGSLPRGLEFHRGHGKATITGKAKAGAVGRHHIRVRATNPLGQDGHRLTIVVKRR